MKRNVLVFISLSILIVIIYLTNTMLVRDKKINTLSRPAVIQEMQKSEEPPVQSFEVTAYGKTRELAIGSLTAIRTSDIFIMVTVVFMIFFFMIK